jgi:hypothetical protein
VGRARGAGNSRIITCHLNALEIQEMNRLAVAVPGPWKDRGELVLAMVEASAGAYVFAGGILMETATRQACMLEFYEHDDQLRRTFEIAGQGLISEPLLDAVAAHESIALVVLDEPDYEKARMAGRFVRALLQAGGIAVKVDSAGVAHSPERWRETCDSDDPFGIYSLFVVLVGGDERYFSCGMHNFGLPDAAVPAGLGTEAGAYLLNVFNVYRIAEQPELKDGETFSLEPGAPPLRLKREPYEKGYDPDEPLYNPHGLWSLLPRDNPPAPRRKRWSLFG